MPEVGFLKHVQVHEPVLLFFLGVNDAHKRGGWMQPVVYEHENGVFGFQLHVLANHEHELRQR